MSQTIPLSSQLHNKLKYTFDDKHTHSKNYHFAPLVVHEFAGAANEYPIVFVKDNETGRFNTVAMLGLMAEENLFWQASGWQGNLVPLELGCHPFSLKIHSDKPEEGLLCIAPDSPMLKSENGELLFDENGDKTSTLKAISSKLVDLAYKKVITTDFVQTLVNFKLLTPSTLTITIDPSRQYDLKGLYTINETALNDLTDEQFCSLRRKHYLGAIYAALLSLQNVQKLIQMKRNAKN